MSIDPRKIDLPPSIRVVAEREWQKRGMTEAEWMTELAGRMERAERSPAPGELAPDFELELLMDRGERTGRLISLSSMRGKNVGLIFGSYTCPFFRSSIKRLNEIYELVKGDTQLVGVYIREAHPADGRQAGPNIEQGIMIESPKTLDERAAVAGICLDHLKPAFPLIIDDMEDSTEAIYKGMPVRLYALDDAGVVRFRSGPGPHFFDPEPWLRCLQELKL